MTLQSHDPWWFNICAKHGGRVVWIGLWRSAPTHSSHSIASASKSSERCIHLPTGFSCYTCSHWPTLSVHSLTRIQVMPCKGNDWLFSQTFPKVIGGVTSTRHVTSSMSFLPRISTRCTPGITRVKKTRGILITVCCFNEYFGRVRIWAIPEGNIIHKCV